MAIGLGKMLGFDFPENFNYPYISKSATEFWRRWHISLGSWFRDYVYIPLGGNRKGLPIQIRNIAIVWLLTGLWHGASWNFVLWGAFYGIILIAEKLFLLKALEKAPLFIGHIYAMLTVLIGWTLFAFDDINKGWQFLKSMFGGAVFVDNNALYLLLSNLPMLLICAAACVPFLGNVFKKFTAKIKNAGTAAEIIGITSVMALSAAYLISGSYNPFLYFRF